MNSPNHTHEFGKIFSDDSTCGKQARLIRRCKICGYTEVVGFSSNITEHNYSKQEIIKHATCSSSGKANLTCTKCGATKSILLPSTNHQYQCNNPFYKKCTICQKTKLTPLAKRVIALSATILVIAGGSIVAIAFLQSSTPSDNSITTEFTSVSDYQSSNEILTNAESSTYTATSETPQNSSVFYVSDSNLDSNSTSETLYLKSFHKNKSIAVTSSSENIGETYSSQYISDSLETTSPESTTQIHETETNTTETEATSEETTMYIETEISAVESSTQTDISYSESDTTSQFEISGSESSTSTQSYITLSVPATSESQSEILPETTAASTEESSDSSSSTVDYSSLIGRLVYGSEILDYIDAGTPIEIITSKGAKYYANIGDNNFDPSVIVANDLYTTNTGTYEGQTILIFNQL